MVKLNYVQAAPSHHEYDPAKRTLRIKVALGKLDLKGDLATVVDIQIEENSIQLLSLA